jgi:hypothetical protein
MIESSESSEEDSLGGKGGRVPDAEPCGGSEREIDGGGKDGGLYGGERLGKQGGGGIRGEILHLNKNYNP